MKMKRVLAGVAALAMCVSAVPAVYSSPAVSLCAYAEDTALSSGNISIASEDEAFAAASVEVTESWFADNNLPEWTEAPNVKPMLSLVQGDNGFTADIDLKDSENADYEYKGDLKITYELPESWDLSGGVSVCYAFNAKTMFVDTIAYLINDVEINGNTITFTLPYDSLSNVTEGDETSGKTDATRLIIMENSKAADFSTLEDGVYDVGLSMFQKVENRSLSMAANTMYRKAKLIVKDGRYYFNLTFNTGVVLYSPAFCNKIYAMDLSKSTVGDYPVYGVSIPGIVTEYFDDDYVKNFTFSLAKTLYEGMGMNLSDEELRAMVEPTVLQNGIKYIKNVTLDVTDSIQEDKTVKLGFCSDIMDSFYDKGVAGSDNGFNTTNVMLSAPVKTAETAEDVLPAERNLDFTELEPMFEKCINTCDTNTDSRKVYTKESFDTYFVPAWSKVFQAYTYANATQEQVDEAVAQAEEAFDNLEKATIGNSNNASKLTALNNKISNAEKSTNNTYTTESLTAIAAVLPEAKAIAEQGDDALLEDVLRVSKELQAALNARVPHVNLAGRSVELADYIGLNTYLDFSDELIAKSPSVKFTYGEGDELVEQTFDFDDIEYVEGKGYKYTVKMNAKNMRDKVVGKVYVDGEEVGLTNITTMNLSTTVYGYANQLINNPATYGDEAVAAAKALLNYGANTQALFDYNTANLANASLSDEDKDLSSVTADTLADYKPTKKGSDDTAKFAGYNLYLDSLTRMRFYYTGDVDASANTANYNTGKSGSKNYVEITDITPANLLNGYDVTIGGMTVHASPASYAHTALTKSDDENLQNAMKAMILYSQAVQAYANSISD